MMPAIDQAILAISNSLAASIIVKATVVISLALITARLARSSRASVRHAILTAGFAVLFALPIAAIVAPPIHIALPIAQNSSAPAADAPQSAEETQSARQTSKDTAFLSTKSEKRESSLLDILFAAWAIGAAIFLAPVVIGLWQVRSLRRTGLPWSRSSSLAAALANKAGLRRGIEVLLHESVAGPMTCGVLRPAVLFPVEAENWNNDDLHRAIAHELEHVRRADWITHCLARIVCAAYWFHPLVWIAWRRLTLEAERACDDAVLSRSEATAYADQLIALARQLTTANKSPLLAMANRSDLAKRVNAVLDNQQRRGRIGFSAVALAGMVTVLFAATISPLKLVAAAQGQPPTETTAPRYEVTSVKINDGGPNRPVTWDETPDGLMVSNVMLELLIREAYGIQSYQIEQAPEWANQKEFDVSARIDDAEVRHLQTLTKEQAAAERRLMLQALLADRFRLVVHHETKDGAAYALVVAKNGPNSKKPLRQRRLTCRSAWETDFSHSRARRWRHWQG
ncbi:MAG TPA: M56 family metallopeptidase [Candidatus Acidoferrales bacterium]